MKREIKFRGKRLDNGEWVYGKNIQFQIDGTDRVCISEEGSQRWLDPETVGQFTGLHDKNGKEIYEGDVLKNNLSGNPFGVVTWHKDGYFFIDCNFGKFPLSSNGYRPIGEMLDLKLDNEKDVFFEVIGNIHDNPRPSEEEPTKPDILDTSIDDLDISVMLKSSLKAADCKTVKDITEHTKCDFLRLRTFSKRSRLAELEEFLHNNNLELKQP